MAVSCTIGGKMKKWWNDLDYVSRRIVGWFGVLVLLAIIVSIVKCGG